MSRKEHLSCYGVLSGIINPLLTKLVRSKWLEIGLVLFLGVYGPRLRFAPTPPLSLILPGTQSFTLAYSVYNAILVGYATV